MDGSKKNVTSNTIAEHARDAICVVAPTSALMRDLELASKACMYRRSSPHLVMEP